MTSLSTAALSSLGWIVGYEAGNFFGGAATSCVRIANRQETGQRTARAQPSRRGQGSAARHCAGAGHTEATHDITIALPRGLADGDRLLVRLGGRHVVPTAVTLHVTLT